MDDFDLAHETPWERARRLEEEAERKEEAAEHHRQQREEGRAA
ncbi:MAG: hypothetical protein PHP57_13880 [Sideroxydans sp.]|nr:hypothetical protein [Sideroxydans sp.]